MTSQDERFLRTEIGTLTRFLRELREDEVIERLQLERRLADVRDRLAEIEHLPQAKSLSIVFGGAPVEGMRSMDAGFGAAALKAFVDAVDAVRASLMADEPMEGGRLPRGEERSLRIVDRAGGSSGFELELPPQVPDEESGGDTFALAIATTLSRLKEAWTTAAHGEAVSGEIGEVGGQAADKVWAFVKVLVDHDAVFAAEFEGRQVRLRSFRD
ncbi:hypothetical protein EA187_19765 [Lujinxingia sediminis]|uniref:Uncharacterized protein n=1 Tax=Lujinxingia sediminis TaxID=2480984 RepID=A0ABY0CMQ8_9DELT|nr:hypothetical protein [Lujinxingia sediminis]RVU40709.1 hypothetical protein EA187_19765 [Lujinxingia sediminis]